jgi:hypothetical protein
MTRSTVDDLTGRIGTFIASDPWDFTNADGTTSFRVELVAIKGLDEQHGDLAGEHALVRLLQPVTWCGREVQYLVVRSRSGGSVMSDRLRAGGSVFTHGVHVSEHMAAGSCPWGADRWRGGLAVIGTLSMGESPDSEDRR